MKYQVIFYGIAKQNHSISPRYHGIITRTGITCKKICYMCESACRWLIIKNVEIFRSYVKYF